MYVGIDKVIYFEDTSTIVTAPNSASFTLSQPRTKEGTNDDLISVTFEIYESAR